MKLHHSEITSTREARSAERLFDEIFETIKQLSQQAKTPRPELQRYLAEAQDVCVALLSAVIEADGKLEGSENDFINTFLGRSHTPDENIAFLSHFCTKWTQAEKRIPEFFEQAVEFDRRSGQDRRYSKTLLGLLSQFAQCSAETDKTVSRKESKLIRDYLDMLEAYAK